MSDHGHFSSYESHKERRTGKIHGAFSRMHRALDGWTDSAVPSRVSPAHSPRSVQAKKLVAYSRDSSCFPRRRPFTYTATRHQNFVRINRSMFRTKRFDTSPPTRDGMDAVSEGLLYFTVPSSSETWFRGMSVGGSFRWV